MPINIHSIHFIKRPFIPFLMSSKIVAIGPAGCGKSCLISRIVKGSFFPDILPTVGASNFIFPVESSQNGRILLEFCDTAGSERFRSISTSFIRSGKVILLSYDISNPASFQDLSNYWIKQIEDIVPKTPRILVGMKGDLPRNVSWQEAEEFAGKSEAPFLETSAKTGYGCEELIRRIVGFIQPEIEKPSIEIQSVVSEKCCCG
jgi:small GTP-binding protein